MNNNYEALLALTRKGIGHYSALTTQITDWQSVKDLAEKQGLSAIVLDGIEKLPDQLRPPKVFLLEWIGETLQGYEYRYELYCRAIAELADFYNGHGYKMMVLKGYACAINWPKPEHRPCGDIDIWLFGKQREADALLEAEKLVQVVNSVDFCRDSAKQTSLMALAAPKVQGGQEFKIDRSHHHHTVFYWGEFMVENHYDFVNVHQYKSSRELEEVFKMLGKDDTYVVDLMGEKVYLPSPNLHALFLLRHNVTHFASTNINLRQVLDWGLFVKEHSNKIDWKWLNDMIEKYHMRDFVSCINAICVEDLGFEATIFKGVQFSPHIKDRVLKDILKPTFEIGDPQYLIPRLLHKFKRWNGNSWKRELCYNESMSAAFWSGVKNHLRKPRTI